MKRSLATAAALLAAAAVAAGCRGKADVPERLSERPPAAVDVQAVAARELVDGIDVTGSLAPRIQADIKSEISGKVAEVYVLEWSQVKRGDALARIDTSEVEALLKKAQAAARAAAAGSVAARASAETARMGLAETQVAVDRAERELARQRGLKEGGLATQQALDDALSQRDAALARRGSLQGQLAAAEAQAGLADAQQAVAAEDVRQVEARMAKSVVRAPFDGVVAERLVNVGEVVGEMQKVVFRLVDNRVLDLTVQVPARLSGAVRPGQPLSFTTDTLPGRVFTGVVKHLNPAVSEADRSVRVTAEIANDDGALRGGIYVAGRIETGRRPGAILVPRAALLAWDTAARTAAVYVVDGDRARRRELRTGPPLGGEVEIVAGLAPGERIVTRGGFALKDGDRVALAAPGGGR
jgi:multidrug efflux pump subunit AcrA (membrane-fusion protein)